MRRKIGFSHLQFEPRKRPGLRGEKEVREGLSAVARTDDQLWLVHDESPAIQRLTRKSSREFVDHKIYALKDFFKLSGDELDLEAIDADRGFLYVCGSRDFERGEPEENFHSSAVALRAIERVEFDRNRFFLGRIPLVKKNGEWIPKKKTPKARAALFKMTARGNKISDLIAADPVLGPFTKIPAKENGLDVEGLAVRGKRIFLGLRGPVLRGWLVIVSFEFKDDGEGRLRPKRGTLAKHYLFCEGLGARDMKFDGKDLLIIAGPTMSLNGPIKLFRWKNAALAGKTSIHRRSSVELVGDLPRAENREKEHDRAEGLVSLAHAPKSWLLIHDRPAPWRIKGPHLYRADVLEDL